MHHLAAAFLRMAPFLRCYAEYCANFVTANEVLAKLRANSPKVDAAFQPQPQPQLQPQPQP